jgi:thiamine biosynthesis protein ThiI
MLFLIKLFPEITIKSRPVRRRQTRQLRKNIRAVLVEIDSGVSVTGEWDSIEVHPSEQALTNPAVIQRIGERLANTPGISLFLEVDKYPLPDFQGILDLVLAQHGGNLAGKTFAVRCKRNGRQTFKSIDVERFVGAGLLAGTAAAGVSLDHPEVTVSLEVRQDLLYLVRATHQGLGGFPLGCQDAVLSLLSGGYDSSVSSYLCIKRGMQTHYCFFNLGGRAHELAVKEVALYLWQKYHSSHRVKFVTVPFEPVVNEILQRVDNAQMAVVLKRMMLRAAARVSENLAINGLCTGESVAQVASQTLANLSVIDEVTDALVLRPLITSDKQEIIDLARQIGTEEFSRSIPEYCAVISRGPTTKARRERVLEAESRLDMGVLDAAVEGAHYQLITELVDDFDDSHDDVDVVSIVAPGDTVIDIRHPDETAASPLRLANPGQLKVIPFYRLRNELAGADRERRLLLFCERGMISRLHAAHLQDDGFHNVAVLNFPQPGAAPAP